MKNPLAPIVPTAPLRPHAKPLDKLRNEERKRVLAGYIPRHAVGVVPPAFVGTKGRHGHPYHYAYEQLQIGLGLGTSVGKHARGGGFPVAASTWCVGPCHGWCLLDGEPCHAGLDGEACSICEAVSR